MAAILFSVFALLFLTVLIFLGQLIFLIPKSSVQAVRANCRRSNGSWSSGRAKIELVEIVDVSGNLLMGFIIMLAMIIGPLFVVHNYIIPIEMAADIFGAFSLDAEEWEANIETGELGDVGAQYEDWGAKIGLSSTQLRFWQ